MSKFMIENVRVSKNANYLPITTSNAAENVNIAGALGKIAKWYDWVDYTRKNYPRNVCVPIGNVFCTHADNTVDEGFTVTYDVSDGTLTVDGSSTVDCYVWFKFFNPNIDDVQFNHGSPIGSANTYGCYIATADPYTAESEMCYENFVQLDASAITATKLYYVIKIKANTVLDDVVFKPEYAEYVGTPVEHSDASMTNHQLTETLYELNKVAFSGSYDDLTDKPDYLFSNLVDNGVKNMIDWSEFGSRNDGGVSYVYSGGAIVVNGTKGSNESYIGIKGGTLQPNSNYTIYVTATGTPTPFVRISGYDGVSSYTLCDTSTDGSCITFNSGNYPQYLIRIHVGGSSGDSVNGSITPMLCRSELYDASDTYQTYAQPNSTLTAALKNRTDDSHKNLLQYRSKFLSVNGITVVVNPDRTVTVNGTAEADSFFYIDKSFKLLNEDCILSGCPAGGSISTYQLDILDGDGSYVTEAVDTGNGAMIRRQSFAYSTGMVRIRIANGYTATNLVFSPMICRRTDNAMSSHYQPPAASSPDLTQALIHQIDNNGKNLLNLWKCTSTSSNHLSTNTVNNGNSITCTSSGNWGHVFYKVPGIEAGKTYVFECVISGADSGSTNIGSIKIGLNKTATSFGAAWFDEYDSTAQTLDGKKLHVEYTATDSNLYIIFAPNENSTSYSNTFTATNCILYEYEQYAISDHYAPYAMSNIDLTDCMGLRRVYANVSQTSITHTYTMNKGDFYSDSYSGSAGAGTYLINVIKWGTSPTFSLYAVTFSGGSEANNTITKIAGSDVSITISSDSIINIPGTVVRIYALR